MLKLLYVEGSPRRAAALSTASANAFLNELGSAHIDIGIDRLDLWSANLPEFDGPLIAAKYAKLAGREMNQAEAEAWTQIGELTTRFSAADAIVIATPMWNFGIPYKFKQWIDLITQPGLTFSFDPVEGYSPIGRRRPALVIMSSAGDYSEGSSYGRPDLATPYLQAALAFLGLEPISVEKIGPTAGSPEATGAARDRATGRLAERAKIFLEQLS